MILLIILVVITAAGVYLTTTWDFAELGFLMILLFGSMLMLHVILISTASYGYGVFVAERDAFEQTLADARSNGNEYELMAITKEVAKWNVKLAADKYSNTTFFLDPYIDDRIDSLEPIK